jgi:crotonobetainyl-CoA:carnitine CoA-transferase CaiB-like acyl-CoA transferase
LPNYLWSGKEPVRTGNGHPNIAPYDAFDTATCAIYVAVGNDRQFSTLCAQLGAPGLAKDPRFASNVERIAHRAQLKAALDTLLRECDGRELTTRLQLAGVPAAPILGIAEVVRDPHARHRDMVIEREDYHGSGFPIKFSRTPSQLRMRPPGRGEHTCEVLAEAGIDPARIESLHKSGALGHTG